MITKTIELRAQSKGITVRVPMVQWDSGRVLRCKITDIQIPEGAIVVFRAQKKSGVIYNEGKVDKNAVEIPITAQILAESGILPCQVEIRDNGEVIKTFRFEICIDPAIAETGEESKTESTYFEGLVQRAETAAGNAEVSEKDAKESQLAAEESAQSAEQSQQQATQSAQNAEQSKNQALQSAQSAKENADRAQEIMNSIPEEYTKLSNLAEEIDRTRAPGITCTVEGEQIGIADASDQKLRGLRVYGKSDQAKTNGYQLFDASKIPTKSQGGATVTNNGDGSFTISGSGNIDGGFSVEHNLSTEETKRILRSGEITLKCEKTTRPHFIVKIISKTNKLTEELNNYGKETTTLSIDESWLLYEDIKMQYLFYESEGIKISEGVIKPMLYQSGNGTWEPYTGGQPSPSPDYPQEIHVSGDGEEIGVNITGNQLFDASKLTTKSEGGATVTNNDDGSFTVSGSGSLETAFRMSHTYTYDETVKMIKPGKLYLYNGGESTRPFVEVGLLDKSTSWVKNIQNSGSVEITNDDLAPEKGNRLMIRFYGGEASQITAGTIKPMLYQNGNGTWEPFKQPQTLQISTPSSLPGIPVESGGNYTDEAGQQWISDIKDYGSGKYYQYVKEVVFDGSEDEGWSFESATGRILTTALKTEIYAPQSNNDNAKILCTSFSSVSANATYLKRTGISVQGGSGGDRGTIQVYDEKFKGADEFTLYLSENPMGVLYTLKKNIITDIPAEEMAAYRELYSNYPNTNVFTDQTVQPGIEMDYTADTKMYVDNKIAQIAAEIIDSKTVY